MYWTKQVQSDGMGKTMNYSYAKGEIRELFESRSIEEALSEWDDVCCLLLLATTNKIGISFPILPFFGKGAVDRWYKRMAVWLDIFDHHSLAFNIAHLENFSNYEKKHKVEKALENANYKGIIQWDTIDTIIKTHERRNS